MRHLITLAILLLLLAPGGLRTATALNAVRAAASATEAGAGGEVRDAALWELQALDATEGEPTASVSHVATPRTAGAGHGGKHHRATTAADAATAQPVAATRCAGRGPDGMSRPHHSSCARFIAIRHIIR